MDARLRDGGFLREPRMTELRPADSFLRNLVGLEDRSDQEFVDGLRGLLGADTLVIFAVGSDGRQRVALASGLPEPVRAAVLAAVSDPGSHPLLFSANGRLHLERGDLSPIPLALHFPDATWALRGVGEGWCSSVLGFGRGVPPEVPVSDPLLSIAVLRRVGERTGAARLGAEAATAALVRLSHEFKTPLVSIKGYAELILDQDPDSLPPRIRDWVRRIAGGANRLAALYRRITAEARTEVADSYEARPVEPGEWVRRCVDEVSALAAGRTLAWSFSVPPGMPRVHVDQEAAQDMLLELLQNAARATPDGGRIEVSLAEERRASRHGVRITVTDSGVGIPLGAAGERLFERFASLTGVLAHHSGEFEFGASGLGLGLTMARGVARAHGGDLWVEARGRDEERLPGSRFHIWLACAEDGDGAIAEAGGTGARVLLLEPDPEPRQILTSALSVEYQVVCVATAAEALAAWGEEAWAACIVEPRVASGGVALLQALRAQPGADTAVILTYSTTTASAEIAAWRAAGADSCVAKPARSRVLLQRLRTIKSRRNRQ